MARTLIATLRFHCPVCGHGLQTRSVDGGIVLLCPECGEAVRAPRHLPPSETTPASRELFPPHLAQATVSATRGLQRALILTTLGVAVSAAGYLVHAAVLGPARLAERDPGPLFSVLVSIWAIEFLLVVGQTVVKMRAYRHLGPVAQALGLNAAVSGAWWGVLLRAIGYGLATLPWLTGLPFDAVSITVKAFAQVGHLIWLLGLLCEFAVLLVWYRVFERAGASPRPVSRYFTASLAAFLALSGAASLTLITMVTAIRRASILPAQSGTRLDFAALTPADYTPVLALATLALATGAALAVLYWRLLRQVARAVRTS